MVDIVGTVMVILVILVILMRVLDKVFLGNYRGVVF